MFSIQELDEKVEALASSRMSLDDFEDWFLAESWGYDDTKGDTLSTAIAAVHHVLYAYECNEFPGNEVAHKLASAV